jgi:hypothetical protein
MAASAKGAEWGVVVRLADGSSLFYSPGSGRQGQEDWSPRESQARRFATQEEAKREAASVSTNAQAQEYRAVRLG